MRFVDTMVHNIDPTLSRGNHCRQFREVVHAVRFPFLYADLHVVQAFNSCIPIEDDIVRNASCLLLSVNLFEEALCDKEVNLNKKGNMVLFRPGEPQEYLFYTADNPEFYWVHFTGSDVEGLLNRCQMVRGENVFFTGLSPDYQWAFRQMIQELRMRRANYADLLALDLQRIFLTANRYMNESKSLGANIMEVIEKATHYFNENYNKPINIMQYALEHDYTPSWFIQNFKHATNITPLQYIVSQRVMNAIFLLENTNYSINQIASVVGYDNPLYFSRLFKKHTGISPRNYRKHIM